MADTRKTPPPHVDLHATSTGKSDTPHVESSKSEIDITAQVVKNVSDELKDAVAGVPLHKMRRYLELIQVTATELPNSTELAAFTATINKAKQQLDTIPVQLDDTV